MARERGPDFVGIGVPKSGTSWLARCLREHPDLFVGKKEISFFTRHFHRGYGWYEDLFQEKEGRLAGEFTPTYFITPRRESWRKEFYPNVNPRRALTFWRHLPAAEVELKARYPAVKPILLLRDPADRAWSYYWHWRERKDKLQKPAPPFERMFEDDGRWIRTCGFYSDPVERWRKVFPDLGVFFHDDIKRDAVGFVRSVCRFLGVSDDYTPSLQKASNPGSYEPLRPETRKMLVELYRPDIERLQGLVGRDLSAWMRA